ncbi:MULTISPECIES: hypothetical protein [unclassified Paraburkholderia]|uniref:hypothetical protein n=1 Tax=unclassified Paraburkholderia TaxID=2615204 RepID=UPI0016223DBB|nr:MULTISPECIES: hypothetical protein [unclassified Paraburkholderia]MBB5448291.1 hypothetical protein [Paraburkholderia sp. WSM4177]MBB5488672.1 hypothetical protein [Paraburkholderia sp. WSM4180]
MNIRRTRADIAKLQAETMRLFAEIQKTNRQQRWLTPFVTASAWLALGTGLAAVVVQLAKLFVVVR